jgi:hypothetical protein
MIKLGNGSALILDNVDRSAARETCALSAHASLAGNRRNRVMALGAVSWHA